MISSSCIAVSGTYRLGVTASELRRLAFTPICTSADPAVEHDAAAAGYTDCVAGYTEWSSTYRGTVVSLGWDWVMLNDGPVALRCVGPRTNVLLLQSCGRWSPSPDAELFAVIAGMPWQAAVSAALCGEPPSSAPQAGH